MGAISAFDCSDRCPIRVKADLTVPKSNFRFTPEADFRHRQAVMSGMCHERNCQGMAATLFGSLPNDVSIPACL